MARKQGNARWKTLGAILFAAAAFGPAGCKAIAPERVVTQPVERREAGRQQLLAILDEQSKLLRLSATTRVTILEENAVEPATILDALRKERGKPYQKKFAEFEVNGSLFLLRDEKGHEDIRVSGEVQGISGMGFTLLGKDESFWMLIPTSPEERDKAIAAGQAAPRAKVLYGTFDPDAVRPADWYSIRPQDFANLLLVGEAKLAIDGEDICYVEKWPDYYIMNFLRLDWPNHIYSKIWIERQGLTMAIHQLFDPNGELVAEARFKDYVPYPIAKDSRTHVDVPSEVDFLWPKDQMAMHVALDDVKLNGEIPASVFDEKHFEGYPTELIAPPSEH